MSLLEDFSALVFVRDYLRGQSESYVGGSMQTQLMGIVNHIDDYLIDTALNHKDKLANCIGVDEEVQTNKLIIAKLDEVKGVMENLLSHLTTPVPAPAPAPVVPVVPVCITEEEVVPAPEEVFGSVPEPILEFEMSDEDTEAALKEVEADSIKCEVAQLENMICSVSSEFNKASLEDRLETVKPGLVKIGIPELDEIAPIPVEELSDADVSEACIGEANVSETVEAEVVLEPEVPVQKKVPAKKRSKRK
jgi:hypothetical protein